MGVVSAYSLDPGPMARLREIQADEAAARMIFVRVSEGEELRHIAKAWRVPKSLFMEWYTTVHAERYEAALKLRADALVNEALRDAEDATPENVGPRKLRVDTKLKIASKWDRARYGEKQELNVNVQQFVFRLPEPAADTASWRASVEKIVNPQLEPQTPATQLVGVSPGEDEGT